MISTTSALTGTATTRVTSETLCSRRSTQGLALNCSDSGKRAGGVRDLPFPHNGPNTKRLPERESLAGTCTGEQGESEGAYPHCGGR